LPGYGYAKVSKSVSGTWGEMIEEYLQDRDTLIKVVQLVDIRHDPSVQDIQMHEWIEHYGYGGLLVATKSDKVSKSELAKKISRIRQVLSLGADDVVIPVSALKKTGVDQLRTAISKCLQED
jgi:GTP-binding protein